jgi:hypothetical protein
MKGSDWSVVYFYLVIIAVIVDFARTKMLLVFLVSVIFFSWRNGLVFLLFETSRLVKSSIYSRTSSSQSCYSSR